MTALDYEDWLVARLADELHMAPEEIDVSAPFAHLGLDSVSALNLADRLAALAGTPVAPTIVWTYPSIEALAAHLAAQGRASD